MTKGRVEAFSDGVIAIIITIMVLELRPPDGTSLHDLIPVLPKFLGYGLSFVFVAIYWNSHHHLFTIVKHVNGRVLWMNLLLLFCLSIVPFTTAWMSEHHTAAVPVATYGINLLACGIGFTLLVESLLACNGPETGLTREVTTGWKNNVSIALYVVAIPLAFVNQWIAIACYVIVAVLWFVPDRRIERVSMHNARTDTHLPD